LQKVPTGSVYAAYDESLEAAADGVIDIKLDETSEEARSMMRIRSIRNVGFDSH
jgi:KaiC/GvpD/RAD55 family RecA-like ATPase